MQPEPSVLDFLKSYIRYWVKSLISPGEVLSKPFPEFMDQEPMDEFSEAQVTDFDDLPPVFFPWRSLLAFTLGLVAQGMLEPRAERDWLLGVVFYVFAVGTLLWANQAGEWALASWVNVPSETAVSQPSLLSTRLFLSALSLGLFAFLTFSHNLFSQLNLTLWLLAFGCMSFAFWRFPQANLFERVCEFATRPHWDFKVTPWMLVVLAGFGLSFFFRTYLLNEVPAQMISDHAEKLWDVRDVLNGIPSLFFVRNTGREFFQFYLTAAIIEFFNTGLTFISLKIGTVFAGLFALVYIYFLGKEVANRRVGLIAMVFAGIAYWPNIISRFGLRFPFYPMFYAPALYYLVRALKRRNQNDFVLCGLFLGLGLNGYSPFRIVPIVLVIAIGLYLLHKQSSGFRSQATWGLLAVGSVSLVIFLPLLRFMTENPTWVLFRTMTRLGSWERPIPGPVWQIFLQNLWNGLTMFAWDNGEVWAISVPHRPALDMISASLFYLGVVLLLIRYIRQRHWFDIFTLVSIPLLMLPSILSLAFPGENPSLNRPAAVIIPVFLLIGMALDGLMTVIESMSASARKYRFSWVFFTLLLFVSGVQNYDLVFSQYRAGFNLSAWNTSEMGEVVRGFVQETGSEDTAWLVGYPYWVDSRLVMLNAGFPDKDNAIWPEQFAGTLGIQKPKLFLININDQASLDALQTLYPAGWLQEYQSKYPDKNFLMFFTLPQNSLP